MNGVSLMQPLEMVAIIIQIIILFCSLRVLVMLILVALNRLLPVTQVSQDLKIAL